MFGQNKKEGSAFFTKRAEGEPAPDKMLVTSIFLTLQGEGPFVGRPAVFIRLAKCNLACSFCDTYFETGDWMTQREILTAVYEILTARYGARGSFASPGFNVGFVITGGEPTLQPGLLSLCQRLVGAGAAFVQIESNGVLARDGLEGFGISLVVSPKCLEAVGASGAGHVYLRPHPRVMAQAVCLKFVVSADEASPYHTIPQWAREWHDALKRPIYISPMNMYAREPEAVAIMRAGGTPTLEQRNRAELISFWTEGLLDRAANKANHEYAAQFALDNGYYLSLQTHLYAGVA